MNDLLTLPLNRLVAHHFPHAQLLRAWPLQGGVSAQVIALEIAPPNEAPRKLVLRRHGSVDLQRNPTIARDEFRLLAALHRAGIVVPQPFLVDESGELLPTPFVLMAFVDGAPDFAPIDPNTYVAQLADQLLAIHVLDWRAAGLDFLPQQSRATIPSRNPIALLHGDYWPGNVLWRAGRLVAVIDWEDAHLGDPLADLANAQLELMCALGPTAMHAFTARYRRHATLDDTHLRDWSRWVGERLLSKLPGWGLDAADEDRIRTRAEQFIAQA